MSGHSRLGRVFISSVFGGLLERRREAAEAARQLGFEAVLTEDHIAQPESVKELLEKEIALCDTYVGLFDRRRGTVPPSGTRDERAITEQELRLARERGLRCLVFLSEAAVEEREAGLREFLEREVEDYETGVWTRRYGDGEVLKAEVVAGLSALRPRLVLWLSEGEERLEVTLDLSGLKPAWQREERLGPVPVDLDLDSGMEGLLSAFLRSTARRRLEEESVAALGAALASRVLPGELAEAVDSALELAEGVGQFLLLEVRTADADALALPWELLSLPQHRLPVATGLLEVVRRLPAPGASPEAPDPAEPVPPATLSALGFIASPLEDQALEARPGAGGMADADLFWEQEQERLLVAFEPVLRQGRGRLLLPDTGEAEELRQLLAGQQRPAVLHLSCHGGPMETAPGRWQPALYLEDAEGRRQPVTADKLLAWLRAVPGADRPALVVLSACHTAAPPGSGSARPGERAAVASDRSSSLASGGFPGARAGAAQTVPASAGAGRQRPSERAAASRVAARERVGSFAEALVRGGVGRVLGMQSTISDRGATAFAAAFYTTLARGNDLGQALRAGRSELAAHGERHEWAIPALFTRRGAGPLVAPQRAGEAPPFALDQARQTFEIGGVTYLAEGYVGRRAFERRLQRLFAAGERLLVIHGLGGIGKSTLAARFAERRQLEGARLLVLYAGRELTPAGLVDELAEKLGVTRPEGLAPEQAEAAFEAALGEALAQVDPTLLLLDNFEDNQHSSGALRDPELGEALLRLARLGGKALCILVTSRYPLDVAAGTLASCCLDLGELYPAGCRKLRMLDPQGLGKLGEGDWGKALLHLGGHPKALELLGNYLRRRPERARRFLDRFAEAEQEVRDRLADEDQERGRKLLVEEILEAVPEEHLPAFDRLCLLEVPLPGEELEALLGAAGLADAPGELSWLRDQGLLASKVAPSALAGGDAVHRLLAAPRQGALAAREGEETARQWHRQVAEHFQERPGPLSDFGPAARHLDAAGDRAGALEVYNRWALHLRDRHAYAACIQVATEGLEAFPPGEEELERVSAAELWMRTHDGATSLGNRTVAMQALERARQCLGEVSSNEGVFTLAGIALYEGRSLAGAGEIRRAEEQLGEAAAAYTRGGFARERAVTLGDIARLKAQSGDVSGALSLHEEMLGIFEGLGDVRSRAGTLGDIAEIKIQAGEVEEARELQEERLAVYRRLGDADGIANTQFRRAQLDLGAQDIEKALPKLAESWSILQRLGRLDGIAFVGSLLGQVLAAGEAFEEARTVLGIAHQAFLKLGMEELAGQLQGLLDSLPDSESP